METLAVTIPAELKERLSALAEKTGHTLDECLTLAVQEFADNWEIHLKDLQQIDENEARAVLKAANE
jgi:predicted DNA-binding protein